MNRLALQCGSPSNAASVWPQGMFPGELLHFAGKPIVCSKSIKVPIPLKDDAVVGSAKPSGRFGQGVEHLPKVECGTANDLEHVGRARCCWSASFSSRVSPAIFVSL